MHYESKVLSFYTPYYHDINIVSSNMSAFPIFNNETHTMCVTDHIKNSDTLEHPSVQKLKVVMVSPPTVTRRLGARCRPVTGGCSLLVAASSSASCGRGAEVTSSASLYTNTRPPVSTASRPQLEARLVRALASPQPEERQIIANIVINH